LNIERSETSIDYSAVANNFRGAYTYTRAANVRGRDEAERARELMKNYFYGSGGNMYKANLHCHTTDSDGRLTPEEIKNIYMAEGYSIVAYTDHHSGSGFVRREHLNEKNFLAINSCEVDLNQKRGDKRVISKVKTYHFNLYATDPDMEAQPPILEMDYNDIRAINQYIADRTDEGFLVCYNHPYWSLQDYSDYSGLKGCFAMEIYNHGCEVVDGYYGYHPQVYDEMLRRGNRIFCVSADDNHNRYPSGDARWDSFGGFVMVNCAGLTYGGVMDALRRGDFYSSQGPEIYEIYEKAGVLNVSCSAVDLIVAFTDGRKSHVRRGDGITSAAFELTGDERYVRIMCRDDKKTDANSNAYWLE